jgi:hypothetical protein
VDEGVAEGRRRQRAGVGVGEGLGLGEGALDLAELGLVKIIHNASFEKSVLGGSRRS